jgi:hypothetical protein
VSLHLHVQEDLDFLRHLLESEPAERPQINRRLLEDLIDAVEERNRLLPRIRKLEAVAESARLQHKPKRNAPCATCRALAALEPSP